MNLPGDTTGTTPRHSARLGIVAMYGLDAFGAGAFASSEIVFFTQVLQRSPGQISVALSTASFVGLALILPFGKLADRVDRRGLLALLNGAIALFMLGYLLPPSIVGFFVTTSLVVLGQRLLNPVRPAVIAKLFPTSRVAVRAAAHVSFNAGFALGSLFSAGALFVGGTGAFRMLLLVNVAMFAACVLIALRLPAVRADPAEAEHRRGFAALRDRPFLVATIANMFGSLHNSALLIGLPLWLLHHTNAPGWVVPSILTVNCLLVVVLQIRLSRGTGTVRGAARTQWRGTIAMACACALLMFTGGELTPLSWTLLAAAVVLLTISEITQTAGAWGLSFALADERRVGEYQSVFGLGLDVQMVVGPLLVTALVSSSAGWPALAVIGLLPVGVATRLLHRWAPDEAAPPRTTGGTPA
ncbi:Major Facilitator Superfamily protein [Amycolatopsis tolypomycina]|uniref:Major Facilitator Superfamily protein n=1 Tax=Amycolatopsis tolypomycina TaxID=208445 RepID=A0A1H4VY34_9PSEU|nr:MFS transporter [Amycolatopsis tolypomycina]SEC85348.1 Major Facilitator Superfamily protein [Amycolatopsis tolypomycina]